MISGINRRWDSTFSDRPLAQYFFEQNALMGDVLIDNPQSVMVDGQNERIADLPKRSQSCQQRSIVRHRFFFDRSCAVIFLLNMTAERLRAKARHRYRRIRLDRESILEAE